MDLEDVYDVIVRNDDVRPIHELWILCPNDVVRLEKALDPSVEVCPVDPHQTSRFDWYFRKRPCPHDDFSVELALPPDPSSASEQARLLTCRPLHGTATWPDFLLDKPKIIETTSSLKVGLFRVALAWPLKQGEVGWLRIRMNLRSDQVEGFSPVVDTPNPFGPPYQFSANLRLDSALGVREVINSVLTEASKQPSQDYETIRLAHNMFARHVRERSGASVVVENHWITVVCRGGVDVVERLHQGVVAHMGTTLVQSGSAEHTESVPALVWTAGSDANVGGDLLHTVSRIMNSIRFRESRAATRDELVGSLAAGDQVEAMERLISELQRVGLLTSVGPHHSLLGWTYDEGDPDFLNAIREIRRVYDAPEASAAGPTEIRPVRGYRNLHPFSLALRVAWQYVDQGKASERIGSVIAGLRELEKRQVFLQRFVAFVAITSLSLALVAIALCLLSFFR